MLDMTTDAAHDLTQTLAGRRFGTVLADPPWRFVNRTGKVAPEHRRLSRYGTMPVEEIAALPVAAHLEEPAHCYLWVPNALLPEGLQVLAAWGFEYKSNIVWHKVRKDGGSDGACSQLVIFHVDTGKKIWQKTMPGSDSASALGMNVTRYSCLELLAPRPGLSSSELARGAFVTRQSMNVLLQALEGEGYVTRPAEAPVGKVLPTRLTPRGRRALRQATVAVRSVEVRMQAGMTGAEQSDASRLLRSMIGSLQADVSE